MMAISKGLYNWVVQRPDSLLLCNVQGMKIDFNMHSTKKEC